MSNILSFEEFINKQFDDFQNELERNSRKEKYLTIIEVEDSFYKLIDDIAGTDLAEHERDRREQDTKSK